MVEIDTSGLLRLQEPPRSPEIFQLRLTAFPDGFIILVADNEIAAYACTEKWLTEREAGPGRGTPDDPQPGRQDTVRHSPGWPKGILGGRGWRPAHPGQADRDRPQWNAAPKIILETTHAQGFFLKRGFKTVRQPHRERGVSSDVMSRDAESYAREAASQRA
ncbi:MAG: hypothetical protein MZV70_17655 [Desulfobacterales bacterium]|nr:hypothetical protein [Desulfobacterales bacterium]